MGADVINMSLGTDVDLDTLHKMVNYATGQGVFVVASVGNEGSGDILYPARYAKGIGSTGSYLAGVGSVDLVDVKTVFSNYGIDAELFTPGEGIYTITRNDTEEAGVTNATGTSFSAPMVAGAITLALGESPSATTRQLIPTMLNNSARDVGPKNPGYPGQMGHGGLDVELFLDMLGYSAPALVKDALLLVDLPLSSADAFLEDRLALFGFDVTTVDDDAASAAMAAGKDLVLISQSISAANITDMFRDAAVPVITWEDALFDDMGMSSGVTGDVDGFDEISIATDHALAVGFSGDTPVYQGSKRLGYGTPGDGAITVATVPGQPEKAFVFAYEQGAMMVGMEAPAKRMGFFFQNDDVLAYDYRGVTLFDAAVLWASYDGSDHLVSFNLDVETRGSYQLEMRFSGEVLNLPDIEVH